MAKRSQLSYTKVEQMQMMNTIDTKEVQAFPHVVEEAPEALPSSAHAFQVNN